MTGNYELEEISIKNDTYYYFDGIILSVLMSLILKP